MWLGVRQAVEQYLWIFRINLILEPRCLHVLKVPWRNRCAAKARFATWGLDLDECTSIVAILAITTVTIVSLPRRKWVLLQSVPKLGTYYCPTLDVRSAKISHADIEGHERANYDTIIVADQRP
jgi:hypothetical protein